MIAVGLAEQVRRIVYADDGAGWDCKRAGRGWPAGWPVIVTKKCNGSRSPPSVSLSSRVKFVTPCPALHHRSAPFFLRLAAVSRITSWPDRNFHNSCHADLMRVSRSAARRLNLIRLLARRINLNRPFALSSSYTYCTLRFVRRPSVISNCISLVRWRRAAGMEERREDHRVKSSYRWLATGQCQS